MDITHLSFPQAPISIARLGESLARLDEAAAGGGAVALALSSRVELGALCAAFHDAIARRRGLAARLHLFALDLCIGSSCARRQELQALAAQLGLDPRQVHLPEAVGDVLRTARAYEAQIRAFFRLAPAEPPRFDALLLAPQDLRSPPCGAATERLAVGVYDVPSRRCSVRLTFASLARASAVFSFGPDTGERLVPALTPVLAARLRQFHWSPSPSHASIPKQEETQ